MCFLDFVYCHLIGCYRSCDPPPNLNAFTSYREDGKQGLKFYTDPNYFYDLWVKEQYKLLEKKKKKGVRRVHLLLCCVYV